MCTAAGKAAVPGVECALVVTALWAAEARQGQSRASRGFRTACLWLLESSWVFPPTALERNGPHPPSLFQVPGAAIPLEMLAAGEFEPQYRVPLDVLGDEMPVGAAHAVHVVCTRGVKRPQYFHCWACWGTRYRWVMCMLCMRCAHRWMCWGRGVGGCMGAVHAVRTAPGMWHVLAEEWAARCGTCMRL